MSGQEAGLNNELKQQIEAFQKENLPKIPKRLLRFCCEQQRTR